MVHLGTERLVEPHMVFQGTAVHHLSYDVADYGRSRDFYLELLGMACWFDDGTRCGLAFGSPSRSLLLKQSETAPVVDHFAVAVADADTAGIEAGLHRVGLQPLRREGEAVGIIDPDGFVVEIVPENAPVPHTDSGGSAASQSSASSGTTAGVFQATAVNHIAYRSADYARARDFYVDLLGLQVVFEDRLKCAVAMGQPEDALYLTTAGSPSKADLVDHLAFSVADFDLQAVGEALRERGLTPEDDGAHAWSIWDPDGYKIQICDEVGVYPGARKDPFHDPT